MQQQQALVAVFCTATSAFDADELDLGAILSGLNSSLAEFRLSILSTAQERETFPSIPFAKSVARQALATSQLHQQKTCASDPSKASACLGVACLISSLNSTLTIGCLDAQWRFSCWVFAHSTISGSCHQALMASIKHALAPNMAMVAFPPYLACFSQPKARLNDEVVEQICYFPGKSTWVVNLPTAPAMLTTTTTAQRRIIIPGSFNPLHAGHLGMANAALKRLGARESSLLFELSVANADKGTLVDYQSRVDQFAPHGYGVVCTKATLFLHKAKLFPRSTFVLGADTVVRLVDLKYYSGSREDMLLSLARIIVEYECLFLVVGRRWGNNNGNGAEFTTCQSEIEAVLPRSLSNAFTYLSEDEFRIDLSSTEIRTRSSLQF